jgi:hypothetical protein
MLKSLECKVKNTLGLFSPVENLVRDATCNCDGIATRQQLDQLVQLCISDDEDYTRIRSMIWDRLRDYDHFHHVKKSLRLVDHLIDYGPVRFREYYQLNLKGIEN